ncbi:RNI-like protein [Microthyrium microscopicum]|uniref:RNI-like protein n=1 Tax=Microthyrium microscopicum TaxID=703497 RepID=A0A6A6U7W3_9PEZI|nr:RNI-like protein [Microthyrium microscopicum]
MFVGKRLSYERNLCTVRYIGPVAGTKGEWLGVEWDDPTRGKHSGQAGGVRYFKCASNHSTAGSFLRPNRPSDTPRTFIEALNAKYAAIIDPSSNVSVRISGKEVQEVGFAKINQQISILSELRIVLVDGLSVSQPVGEEIHEHWAEYASSEELQQNPVSALITQTCPRITELDLSRNLFQGFDEVALICQSLPRLTALRLDGNRFSDLSFVTDLIAVAQSSFGRVDTLSLEETLLSCEQIIEICRCFKKLVSLNLSTNQLRSINRFTNGRGLPNTLTFLNLSANVFTAISDFRALTTLTNLQALSVNHGMIRKVIGTESSDFKFPTSLSRLELAYNEIDSWSFVDTLPSVFPGLQSFRISHNPLFQSLQTLDGRPMSNERGYMLTIARMGNLKALNFSNIAEKDRLDAEAYYLGQIIQEVQLNPSDKEAEILATHPRYAELCEIYGTPDIRRPKDNINPNSLAASLMTLQISCEDEHGKPWPVNPAKHDFKIEVPKRFSIYSVIGVVSKRLDVLGNQVQLFWKTGEWQFARDRNEVKSLPWDSDDSDDEEENVQQRVLEEVFLKPSTRSIGNLIDGTNIQIRAKCLI